ncbi:hypothetical protein SAMN04490198_4764 [Pseudomonas palleroniana]|uniref:Uncharacterized protein n=1 Tax=Pseudomonas palleroniana TaxID=191390 RepID=A0A1H5NUY7_9PSED|nr:hypothetical protein SAMN04490198_4764 [Pseudomonas palleroniana]
MTLQTLCNLLFSWTHYLTNTLIDFLCYFFGGVSKQPASVRQLNLAGCFRANVLELKLANQHCQKRASVSGGFNRGLLAGMVPTIAQHLLAHPKAGCVGDRNSHNVVSTKHQNKKDGKLSVVTIDNCDAPDGLPAVHTYRHIYPNKTAAESAAKARLAAFNRSTADVRLEMPGRTDIFAERSINAQGFKVGLDGEYLVDSVERAFLYLR